MPQIRRQTCFACALWSVLILAPLAGLTAGFQQYLVSTFTMNDGLPLNQISAVVQTRDGFLWVATRNGLARFDGVRFTIFEAQSVPNLRNNMITALFEDREGWQRRLYRCGTDVGHGESSARKLSSPHLRKSGQGHA